MVGYGRKRYGAATLGCKNRKNYCNYSLKCNAQPILTENNLSYSSDSCAPALPYSGGLTLGQKERPPPLFFYLSLFENLTSVKIASYGFLTLPLMGFKKLAPLEFEVLLPYRTVTVQYPYRTVSNRILPYPRIWLDTVRVRVRVRYGAATLGYKNRKNYCTVFLI